MSNDQSNDGLRQFRVFVNLGNNYILVMRNKARWKRTQNVRTWWSRCLL